MVNKPKTPFDKTAHVPIIYEIAKGLKAIKCLEVYLELGVAAGGTFNRIAPLAKRAIAVDIRIQTYKSIKRNKNLKWYHGSTNAFFKQYKKTNLDLVFIDADHSHKASMSDFKKVFPLVKRNGIIILHDTYPPSKYFIHKRRCGDSYKTAIAIKRDYKDVAEIMTLPFYYGITIIRKIEKEYQLFKE